MRNVSCGIFALMFVTGCVNPIPIELNKPYETLDATISETADWGKLKGETGNIGRVVGTGVGAVGGGALGSGKGRGGTVVGGVGGALVGYLFGWVIDLCFTPEGLEITVLYRDGREETFVQVKGKDKFYVSQEVKVLAQGDKRYARPKSSQATVILTQ